MGAEEPDSESDCGTLEAKMEERVEEFLSIGARIVHGWVVKG
jgi:hypothetical protein